MIQMQITDSDMIVLQSVESYLKSINTPACNTPQEKLVVMQAARDSLYRDITNRFPRIAAYIMAADMETDTTAQALYKSLYNHAMDPRFIEILLMELRRMNSPEENGATGALLTKFVNKYIELNWKQPDTKKKEKEESKPVDMGPIAHIQDAISKLLGDVAQLVACRCGNLTQIEATAIAACLAMNNKETITELVASNLPITAQILDLLSDPSNVIKNALLLEKSEFPKTTTNQQTFLDSLTKWVYEKLDIISTQNAYQFLVATYGSMKPKETQKYFIQIKDCGTQYSNLRTVAQQMINA